jgi:2,4-dienoyl-CoA reductase-like NADH-dependent reductase (Old Yellow Enzyme family)
LNTPTLLLTNGVSGEMLRSAFSSLNGTSAGIAVACPRNGAAFMPVLLPVEMVVKLTTARKIVERGDVDMIGLGRPLREDPDFVSKALRGQARRMNM